MQVRDDKYRQQYEAHELLEGERLVNSWTASGGELVLTTQRLLSEPMRTPQDILFGPVAKLLGYGEVGDVLAAGVQYIDTRKKWAIPLSDISAVEPQPDDSTLSFQRTSGEVWAIKLAASLYTPRWSDKNRVARDEAVAAIRAAVSAVRTTGAAGVGIADISSAIRALQEAQAPPPPSATTQIDPRYETGRRRAIASGQNVVVEDHEDGTAYFSPTGLLHASLRGYGQPKPASGTLPGNLVGRWVVSRGDMASVWQGQPTFFHLAASGSLGGAGARVWGDPTSSDPRCDLVVDPGQPNADP